MAEGQQSGPLTAGTTLYAQVREILEAARSAVARTVNSEMVRAYWLIGRAIVEEDCPWIPTLHSETFALTQQWLKNFRPHPVSLDGMKYWRVDGPLRARLQAEWNRPNYWPILAIVALAVIAIVPAATVVQARTNRRVRRSQEETRS